MKTLKILSAVLLASTFMACSSENETTSELKTGDGIIAINSSVGSMMSTKATGSGTDLQDNGFKNDAEISVYLNVHGNTGTSAYPQPLTYKYSSSNDPNMSLTGNYASNTYYFPTDGKGVDAYAIYPTTSFSTGITITSDQSDDSKYLSNDWMFGTNNPSKESSFEGTKRSEGTIPLTFTHIMSKIVVKLVAGFGVTDADLNNASIKMFRALPQTTLTSLSVNGYTLGASSGTAPAEGYSFGTYNSTNGNSIIIVPQKIAADSSNPLFQVSIGSGTYSYCLQTDKTFEGSNSYIYTFNLSSEGLKVKTVEVKDWTTNNLSTENITLD